MLLFSEELQKRGHTCSIREALKLELTRPQKTWNPDECEWWLKMKPAVLVMEKMLEDVYRGARVQALDADKWFHAKKYALELIDRLKDKKVLIV